MGYLPQRNRTQYDVRPRRPQTAQPVRNVADNRTETGPQLDKREPFVDLIGSDGFRAMVLLLVLPAIREIRTELLQGIDLPENKRQRLVASLQTFETLLNKIYEKAGEPFPSWLAAQFK